MPYTGETMQDSVMFPRGGCWTVRLLQLLRRGHYVISTFADYDEDLYRKRKHNEITSVQAKELGGPGLLDLMEAQWILDTPGTRRGLQE